MKYVRTKDKIIPYYDDLPTGKLGVVIKYLGRVEYDKVNEVFDEIVIKEANTIEELTDAYVIVPKDQKSKPYTVNTLSVFDDIKDVLKHNDIYSSIWVNAILKPIAKMNDKGVLEYYEN